MNSRKNLPFKICERDETATTKQQQKQMKTKNSNEVDAREPVVILLVSFLKRVCDERGTNL